MFTHRLPKDDRSFAVAYAPYAIRHFLKRFQKDYKGRQWQVTEEGVFEDLSRITYTDHDLQQTGQIDELKHLGHYWLAKYDFKIAGTKESTKGSGNRCVLFFDNAKKTLEILLIFNKTDLPKNCHETQYIYQIVKQEFPKLWELLA